MSYEQDVIDAGIAVWDYVKQDFVPLYDFIPCPGQKRVRVDVHGPLDNLAVFPVQYKKESDSLTFELLDNTPLDYEVNYS